MLKQTQISILFVRSLCSYCAGSFFIVPLDVPLFIYVLFVFIRFVFHGIVI